MHLNTIKGGLIKLYENVRIWENGRCIWIRHIGKPKEEGPRVFSPTCRPTWWSTVPTHRNIEQLQKFLNFTRMKISLSEASFIPVTKSNLARKSPNFASNLTKTLKMGVLDSTPNKLRRLNRCLSFVPGVEGSLLVAVVDEVGFKKG